ncbi:Imm32 family immunity protein [Hwanghaeella grinnelliae]|uniref:Imm32 family immunity protein n=1 Tax=Hwanghaeella grinnelliae TaxID=2500179 RepID=UPI003B837ED6
MVRMISQVRAACDGDQQEPEISISGSAADLRAFGSLLNSVTSTQEFELPASGNEFYPHSLTSIVIVLRSEGTDRVKVSANAESLFFEGTNHALRIIGDSLLNYFDHNSSSQDHFHLDYYEGDQVLEPTNCHLIFECVG